jgi:predicted nuclease of predicted toxin-antitoxin system
MKFLIDNNLSFKLAEPLQNDFPGTAHVRNTLNVDVDDEVIWDFSKTNDFTILTKDNDFDEISQLKGCPPKVIHLLCGNQTTSAILQLFLSNKQEITKFLSDSENCLLKIA